jgi:hypothetical protein
MKYDDILKTGTKVMLRHQSDKSFERFCVVGSDESKDVYNFARFLFIGEKYAIEKVNAFVNSSFGVENGQDICVTYSASFGGSIKMFRNKDNTRLFDKYEKILKDSGMMPQAKQIE